MSQNHRNENTMRLPIWMLLSFLFALLLAGCMATEPSDPVSKMSVGDSSLVVDIEADTTQICMHGKSLAGSAAPWRWGITLVGVSGDTLDVPVANTICRQIGSWKIADISKYEVTRYGNVTRAYTIERGDTTDVTELAKLGAWTIGK